MRIVRLRNGSSVRYGRVDDGNGDRLLTQGKNNHTQMPSDTRLERFVDSLIEANMFRNRREVARECGMSDAALSQVLKNDPQKPRRLSVEQCLRLARKIHAHPAEVLKMAGRPDMAAIVTDLWPTKLSMVTRSEKEMYTQWRTLTVNNRYHIRAIIRVCAEQAARTTGAGRSARAASPRSSQPKRTRQAREKS